MALPAVAVTALLVVFVILPRFTPQPSIVACPTVSPAPQIAASPNPAQAGSAVTFTATGFDASAGLFIVIDSAGDCTNPLRDLLIFTEGAHADPLTADPIPLPAALKPGDYLLRACTHNVGSDPTNCVQVPFTITAPAVAKAVAPAPRVVLSAP